MIQKLLTQKNNLLKLFVKKLLYTCFLLTIVFYIVFIVTAVMEFLNDSTRWIVLAIAIVHMFIAIPLAFFTFYKGY